MVDILDLVYYHKWTFSEIDNMLPWEFDVYLDLLTKRVDEDNAKQEKARQAQKF